MSLKNLIFFFFFNDTATTEIYTLSLHDALPISCDAAHDDQRQAKQKTGKKNCEEIIDAVSEDDLDPAVQCLHTPEQRPGSIRVLDVGGVNHHAQQQPLRVDRNVALAPRHPLRGVIAARPSYSVVFTLCVSMIAAVGLASRPSGSRSI